MIYLTQNKKVQLISDTANLEWSASWVLLANSCNGLPNISAYNENQGVTTNGTIDIVPIPTSNTNVLTYYIGIEYLSVVNVTGGVAVISFGIYSATIKKIFSVTLQSGDQVTYNEDSGWQVFDKNGATKNTSSTITTNFVTNEIPTGAINSSNVTFTLAHSPTSGSEMVYYNGQLQRPITDYTISTNTITFVTAPDTGTNVYVSYRY